MWWINGAPRPPDSDMHAFIGSTQVLLCFFFIWCGLCKICMSDQIYHLFNQYNSPSLSVIIMGHVIYQFPMLSFIRNIVQHMPDFVWYRYAKYKISFVAMSFIILTNYFSPPGYFKFWKTAYLHLRALKMASCLSFKKAQLFVIQ